MLTPTKAWKDSSGTAHASLEEAQIAELTLLLLPPVAGVSGLQSSSSDCRSLIEKIVSLREKVVDILTTCEGSRPVARKVNGGKKLRKAKPDAQQQISI